jgi:hypothetical protein
MCAACDHDCHLLTLRRKREAQVQLPRDILERRSRTRGALIFIYFRADLALKFGGIKVTQACRPGYLFPIVEHRDCRALRPKNILVSPMSIVDFARRPLKHNPATVVPFPYVKGRTRQSRAFRSKSFACTIAGGEDRLVIPANRSALHVKFTCRLWEDRRKRMLKLWGMHFTPTVSMRSLNGSLKGDVEHFRPL